MSDAATRYVIELFLPLESEEGEPFGRAAFDGVRDELLERFGGVTLFTRNPAEGLWSEGGEGVSRDRIVTVEVVAETLDRGWWADYRQQLERRFRQQEILIRSYEVLKL